MLLNNNTGVPPQIPIIWCVLFIIYTLYVFYKTHQTIGICGETLKLTAVSNIKPKLVPVLGILILGYNTHCWVSWSNNTGICPLLLAPWANVAYSYKRYHRSA